MLYDLVQKRRGKETVVMTDELPKVNSRMKTLRQSQRRGVKGDKVEYSTRPAEEGNEKFYQKPHRLNLSGGPKKYSNGRRRAKSQAQRET